MSEVLHEDEQVARLFDEFLRAIDEGRDLRDELLARAGPGAPALRARIELWEELGGLDVDAEPPAPVQLGRFHILRELGHGGLGRVYLAHDPRLARQVALKVLDGAVATPGEDGASVLNEVRSVARLDHPGIVKVHEVAQEGHRALIVMEYVPGPSLARVVAAIRGESSGDGDATASKAAEHFAAFRPRIECLARIAEALAYCHDHGVLHRDIKPANVLFDADHRPKLIDFGLAHDDAADDDSRTHLTQRLVGTAANVAPEQVADGRSGANPRSDQFSFSTLAYELIALENPFDCGHRRRTLDAIERCRPRPLREAQPAVPPDLHRVIHHGLEREPDERYPDMGAMAGDLRAILESRPITIAAPSLLQVLRLWSRRHRHFLRVCGLVAAGALLLWAVTWSVRTQREDSRILEDLSAIDPTRFEDVAAFEASTEWLSDLKRRSQALDESALHNLLWGPTLPRVMHAARSWSHQLATTLDRDLRRSVEDGIPLAVLAYSQLIALEQRVCPECPYNAAARRRGLVGIEQFEGEVGRLYRLTTLLQVPPDMRTVYRPTPLTRFLSPGRYRWQTWSAASGQLARETEFDIVEVWGPEFSIDPRAAGPLLDRTHAFAASELTHEGATLRVPAFRLLDHLVTNEEFDRFLADTGHAPLFRERESDDVTAGSGDPAWVDLDSAMRMAQWAGGRVPTYAEIERAVETGVVSREPSPLASGEHVVDRSSDSQDALDAAYVYGTTGARLVFWPDRRIPVSVAGSPPKPGSKTLIGFRLAFSTERL